MSENDLIKTLKSFFPLDRHTDEGVIEGITSGELIVSQPAIANYLQGALHDESLLEVELANLRRIFFARVLDHPPEEEDADDDDLFDDMPYSKGEYLDDGECVILTPLEPSEGNYLINESQRVLLRVLTAQAGIEFCCYFEEKTRIGAMPVLKLSFPEVARQVEGAREYRVKVPRELDLQLIVNKKKSSLSFTTRPMDMSVSGMCLYDPGGKNSALKADDRLSIDIIEDDTLLITVDAVVRHVTRLRDASGLQYVFGVLLNLESRTVSTEVEKLVASIQRARLRALVEIEDEYGLNLSDW